jgi:RecJ-like exonuclease
MKNKICKHCKAEEGKEKFRGNVCPPCDNRIKNEQQKKKREERWKFLGLDMSTKF